MNKDELLHQNSQIGQKKITSDPKKEMFIKKKDIYLLNLLEKRKNQSIFKKIASLQKSLLVKNSSDLSKKTNSVLNQMPKIQQKTNRTSFKTNNSLIITNIPSIKEYSHIRDKSYISQSTLRKFKDKNLNTSNISNINFENAKTLNDDNQNESKKSIEDRNKSYSLNRIPLNYMKKIKSDFKFDQYFIEYIKDKNIFITPNKPKKLLKRTNYNYITKNSINNSSIKNNSSNNRTNSSNIIKDFKIKNPLIVIPCKKNYDHMKVFNEIIFNEFGSKKQNSFSRHRCFQTNIFDGNINNNLGLYQKIYNSKNRRNFNQIAYNNLCTMENGLNFPSFRRGRNNKGKKLVDEQNQIDFPLKGVPNVVKRFYGV